MEKHTITADKTTFPAGSVIGLLPAQAGLRRHCLDFMRSQQIEGQHYCVFRCVSEAEFTPGEVIYLLPADKTAAPAGRGKTK